MIDIFSVKTWEFSDKEKEARSKAVGSEAVETEAVISEEVEAVRPVIPNIPRVREAVKAVEAEAVEAEAVATSGLEKLISNNVIELTTVETNVQRYYMTDSTPF